MIIGLAVALLVVSTTVVMLVVAVCSMFAVRRRRRLPRRQPIDRATGRDDFDELDVAEIEALLNAVDDEQGVAHRRRLAGLVQPLVDRGVPARVVEVAPGFTGARIRFADGTTVLACGDSAGDLGILAAAMREGSATPASCITNASGTHVLFALPGRTRRLSVRVVGVDQPS